MDLWQILHKEESVDEVMICSLTSLFFRESIGTMEGTTGIWKSFKVSFFWGPVLLLELYHSKNFNKKMDRGRTVSVVDHAILINGCDNFWILDASMDDNVSGMLAVTSVVARSGLGDEVASTLSWSAFVIREYEILARS